MKQLGIVCLVTLCLVACMSTSETTKPKEAYYQEDHRLQYHFSPEANWMNDPNGMVYYKGEYHLFYQYYPDSNVWGPMHWGHAISKDMVNWEHMPVALFPDEHGYIFSGSAVVDHNNTSGFKNGEESPLVAIFSYHDPVGEKEGKIDFQTQGIAYSNDKGRTWTKYEGNPVIPNPGIKDFRDPKVFWHAESEQWVMILAVQDHVRLYHSSDLKEWTYASEFGKEHGSHGGVWECPDLFELAVDGDPNNTRWVLILNMNPGNPNGGSGTQYFIGSFDGKTFTSENPGDKTLWLEYGRDNYAGVTWSDVPKEDGRRLFMGWMSNWAYAQKVPTTVWRSAMTVSRSMELTQKEAGVRAKQSPIKELDVLRGDAKEIPAQAGQSHDLPGSMAELILKVKNAEEFSISLSNDEGEEIVLGLDGEIFYTDRTKSGKSDFSDTFATKSTAPWTEGAKDLDLHIFIDVASMEIFVGDGSLVMTDIFFPNSNYNKINLSASGDGATIGGTMYALGSIWQ